MDIVATGTAIVAMSITILDEHGNVKFRGPVTGDTGLSHEEFRERVKLLEDTEYSNGNHTRHGGQERGG